MVNYSFQIVERFPKITIVHHRMKDGTVWATAGRNILYGDGNRWQLHSRFPFCFPRDLFAFSRPSARVMRSDKCNLYVNSRGNVLGIRGGQVYSFSSTQPSRALSAEEIKSVVETNILGELYGTKVAMQGFVKQGFGALYNVEGMGANGKNNNVKGLSIYGMTKAGLHYFNMCLAQEIDNPLIISGSLQPGMILTDMVVGQYKDKPAEWEKVKGILGVIANPLEEVAPWLVEKMLTNQKKGAHIAFGGTLRTLKKFALMPFRRK